MSRPQTHEDFTRGVQVARSSDRAFGIVFSLFFLAVGLWPLAKGGIPRLWAIGLSALFLFLGLVRPSWLHGPNRIWTQFGLLLGRVINPVVTGVMFYLVFTPIALVLRLLGKDLLRLRFDASAGTYWIERKPPGPAPDSMANQF